jgi:hypothetical protein
MEMLNVSVVPGSPLSVTATVKVHGAPLLMHVPPNVAVVSLTENELNVTLCTLAPVAWLMHYRVPWIGASALARCTVKPNVPMLSATAIEPPPVILPPLAAAIFTTNAS